VRRIANALGGWSFRSGALLAVSLVAAAVPPAPEPARAETGGPAFTTPLAITNAWLPFVEGAAKVYEGVDHGVRVTLLERHLSETREFAWGGASVACRVAETIEFHRGVESGRTRVYLAQADDGSVWTFGETDDASDEIEPEDPDEPDGWLVGVRAPTDPPRVVEGASPGLLMPAAPKAGDTWTAEDAAPSYFKRDRVVGDADAVRVPSGRLAGCLRVREADVPDASAETRWYAQGLGLVRTREPGELVSLQASTIRARR
jgi:hypothetical protein